MCISLAKNTLQHLYEQAVSTFHTTQQPKNVDELDAVQQALQQVSLQDLGMQHMKKTESKSQNGLFKGWAGLTTRNRDPALTYTHIHEDRVMSIGIFCMEQGATIPFHNHPGMVVLSRVLYGDLHVKSYDWSDGQSGMTSPKAKLVLDKVIDSGAGPAAIFPASGGNIHQFTAVTDCAVLDVLAPPYSPQGGRDCTYYHVESTDEAGVVHLRIRNPAPYLAMRNLRYQGVLIQPLSHAQH